MMIKISVTQTLIINQDKIIKFATRNKYYPGSFCAYNYLDDDIDWKFVPVQNLSLYLKPGQDQQQQEQAGWAASPMMRLSRKLSHYKYYTNYRHWMVGTEYSGQNNSDMQPEYNLQEALPTNKLGEAFKYGFIFFLKKSFPAFKVW